MRFVNLTPHAVVVIKPGDIRTVLEPSGTVARLVAVPGVDICDDDFTIPTRSAPTYGEIEGLPEYAPGVSYIVSGMVAAEVRREDVYSPDTGPDAVRNDKGQIVGVRRLIRSV